jgi:iron complex transport system substrate-binding protein
MKIPLHRLIWFLLVGLLVVTLIAACNRTINTNTTSQQPEDCRIVQHVMGETCIPRNPQRVITLRPDTFVNSWVLGVKPIASADEIGAPLPNYLEGKVEQVESVGSYDAPELEKILRLKPDLILSNSYMEGIYEQLSRIAPTVVLNYPWPPLGWKKQLEELAQILDKEEVGKQLMNEYWQRIEYLQQALGDRRQNLKVSVVDAFYDSLTFTIYGEKHYSGTVLSDVGLQRPSAQQGGFFYIENISEEKISDIDGDILFLFAWELENDKEALEKFQQNPLWQQLSAVQHNQVYFVGEHWHEADVFAINAILDDLEKYLINTPKVS